MSHPSNIQPLIDLMRQLRDPNGGCPWDQKQTFASIAPHTLSETFEVIEAILNNDLEHLQEELGDLLFQIVFYAQMADELGRFNMQDVIDGIVKKMIRRHPHVFAKDADSAALSDAQLQEQWQVIKQVEKAAKTRAETNSLMQRLHAIAADLPGMQRARQIQQLAAETGFDWPNVMPVLDKMQEELDELREAVEQGDEAAVQAEYGDLLFVCANFERHKKLQGEVAVRQTTHKFLRRFEYVLQALAAEGIEIEQASLAQMESHWQAAKAIAP